MPSTPFKNILIVGAGGSLGSNLLQGLLAEPTFTVTALQRASSKSQLPASLPIITIPDDYPKEQLVATFTGRDVVVNAMTSTAVGEQKRFIDAAMAAGVRHYVASEYGLNNLNPAARSLSPVFDEKGRIREYLMAQEGKSAMTWTAIACGMWIKWSMRHDFLGMHIPERRFVLWDEGRGKLSCTTMENTVLALRRALLKPDETANRCLYVSDFAISQAELFAEIERQAQGEKWTRETVNSEEYIRDAKKRYDHGDMKAVYDLIETGFVTGKYGGHLEAENKLDNELLGLPKNSFEDVVKEGLIAMKVI
ncbi:NmrA-like family protein [Lineolata rhizophorae]|uniref:NmrA-like family protein n=1 Tax=Lineolata rhizophorae TaxID=578093 RepID=A0A6A6PD02_9PEZI|nr:NmrA-like family protein [Lineolata rhizophorae]